MGRFFEFIANHWILSSLWVFLAITLVMYQKNKAGKAIGPQQATLLVNRSDGIMLDIRDKKEFDKGHIVNAINIPLAKLSDRVSELEKYQDKPVIVVCKMGNQSGDAVKILQQAGFTQVSRLSGGMSEWRGQSLPLVSS